jgi:ribosomal protein L28
VRMLLSTSALRTMTKLGVEKALRKALAKAQ